MWCYEHHAEITAMVNDTTHVLIQSQELQREDVATLCGWMLLLDRQHSSHSPGTSSRPSHSPGTSSRPSHSPRSAQNLGMAECSNCKFLAERIKTLEARISVLEGQLEMERHPENHTLWSSLESSR
ncbi:hypothetical protein Tco_1075153 [Tanacetum coccineum]